MVTGAGNDWQGVTGRTWTALAVVMPVIIALIVPMPAVDLAYQVRAGNEILAAGALPSADTWTFTIAGAPWVDQQWLAQVLLALGHRAGGWELLAVLRAVLVGATSGLLVLTARLRGATPAVAAVLSLLAFMLAAPALALRPQLFAILLLVSLLALASARCRCPRVYLAAPALVVLWANLHGSFILAPVLLGWVWLDDVARGRPWRQSFAVLAAGCIATLITPFGPGAWAYAAGIGMSPVIASSVSEWQRTTPSTVPGLLFFASLAATAAIVWRGRARLAWPDVLWLAVLALLGVWAIRGLAWWPAGAVPVVAAALSVPPGDHAASSAPRDRRSAGAHGPERLLMAVLAVALIAALPWWRPPDPLTGRQGLLAYAPSGLAQALRTVTRPGTRVFVPQPWGSWFEWAVPDARYFTDARFELFPVSVWDDLRVVAAGGDASNAVLRRHSVELMVLPSGWPVPGASWEQVYSDADGAILCRLASCISATVP